MHCGETCGFDLPGMWALVKPPRGAELLDRQITAHSEIGTKARARADTPTPIRGVPNLGQSWRFRSSAPVRYLMRPEARRVWAMSGMASYRRRINNISEV